MWTKKIFIWLLWVWATCWSTVAISTTPKSPSPAGLDYLLLDVYLNNHIEPLDNNLIVYFYHQDDFYLPLIKLFKILQFDIAGDINQLHGWIINQQNFFSFEQATGKLVAGKHKLTLMKPRDYIIKDQQIYLKSTVLEKISTIKSTIDMVNQGLLLTCNQTLPIDLQRMRMIQRQKLALQKQQVTLHRQIIPHQYQWLNSPVINLYGKAFSNHSSHYYPDYNYSLTGYGDLLKHNYFFTWADSNQGKPSSRITFYKRGLSYNSPISYLPLGVTEYQFGDILVPTENLIRHRSAGAGILLGKDISKSSYSLDNLVIADNAPPGWEAELYLNGSLVDFTTVTENGRYVFEKVLANPGINLYSVKLYGPQGQIRVIDKTIKVGTNLYKQGQSGFVAFYQQPRRSLLQNYRINNDDIFIQPSNIRQQLEVDYYYGITDNWSVGTGVNGSEINLGNSDNPQYDIHNYLILSSDLYTMGVNCRLETDFDVANGYAYQINLTKPFWRNNLLFEYQQYHDFEHEQNDPNRQVDNQTKLMLFGGYSCPLPWFYQLSLTRYGYNNHDTEYDLYHKFGFSWNILHISNLLEYRHNHNVTNYNDFYGNNLNGSVIIAARKYSQDLTGYLDYKLIPYSKLYHVAASWRYAINNNLTNTFRVDHYLTDNHNTHFSNYFTWSLRKIDLSLGVEYDHSSKFAAYLALGTSLWLDQTDGKLHLENLHGGQISRYQVTTNSPVPIEELKFINYPYKTDSCGRIHFATVPPINGQRFDLDKKTINDPFLVPTVEGFEIYTHPGSQVKLAIPLIEKSIVEGQVNLLFHGDLLPAANIPITLCNQAGNIIQAGSTDADGYYSFEIAQRKYKNQYFKIKFDNKYLARHKISQPKHYPIIKLTHSGEVISCDDINLHLLH